MQRLATAKMLQWKNSPTRKPLLIDGARQTGKTWLVEQLFGPHHFSTMHSFDFRNDKTLHTLFETNLRPSELIQSLSVYTQQTINPHTDLIFFDEIGECQGAVDALKYFAQELPQSYVCASGSNIGLLNAFPVGKVQTLHLYPMTFEEFLMAGNNPILLEAFQNQSRIQGAHIKLWEQLLDYYYVGGLPEAVTKWFETDLPLQTRIEAVHTIHADLIQGYHHDFGKYSGRVNALHIAAVFDNIPSQLAQSIDSSVKRYSFKEVIPQKSRYRDLATPIDWLCRTKLAPRWSQRAAL